MGKQNKSNRKKSGSGINKIVMRKGRPSLLLTVTRHAPTIVFIGLLGFLYFWLQTKSPKITDDMIVQQLALIKSGSSSKLIFKGIFKYNAPSFVSDIFTLSQ